MTRERIVAAALQIDGLTYSLPRPAGHAEIFMLVPIAPGREVQGFLTSEGRFVTRVEAMKIVHRAGQEFRTPQINHELFSENLW